ncbi:MAG: hypothetical protein WCD89_14695 [Anaerocolumna sp.]
MDKQNKPQNNSKKNRNIKTSLNTKPHKEIKKEIPVTDWFYMTPNDVNAKMISDILKSERDIEVELWEEMNVLQIIMIGNKPIDFELVEYQFKDPSDAAFIKNRNIKTIFAVTIEEGTLESFKPILKIMIDEWDGFLCADSVSFKPSYGINDL